MIFAGVLPPLHDFILLITAEYGAHLVLEPFCV